jgi:hypothetical protein
VKKNMIDLIYAREKTSIWVKDCLSDKLFDIFAPEVELWGFLSSNGHLMKYKYCQTPSSTVGGMQ